MSYTTHGRPMSRASTLMILAALAAACSDGGQGGEASAPASIQSFAASPERLEGPGSTVLSWATKDAVSLRLTRDGEPLPLEAPLPAGTVQVAVEETSVFELIATGRVGAPARETLTVTVAEEPPAPSIGSFSGPAMVGADELGKASATLAWTGVEGAAELILEASHAEPIAIDPRQTPDGSLEVELEDDTTFTLIARSEAGEAREELTVRLIPLPTIDDLRADRSWVGIGERVEISWETSLATSVELWIDDARIDGIDEAATTGSAEVPLLFTSQVELRAFNEAGSMVARTVEILVAAPGLLSSSISSTELWLGETLTLSWSSAGAIDVEVRVDGVEAPICQSDDPAVVGSSSCEWQPPSGDFLVILSLSNPSGVTSSTWSVRVGTGPTLSELWAFPAEITDGDEIEIGWAALPDPAGEAPTLTLSDDRGRSYPVQEQVGSLRIPIDGVGTFEFTMVASTSHPSSVPVEARIDVVAHGAPLATLLATPAYFDDSQVEEVVLSWTSEYAASLVLYELGFSGLPIELLEIPPEQRAAGEYHFIPTAEATYRLVATNPLGASSTAEASVALAPPRVLAFTADRSEVEIGEPVLLSWSTSTADDVALSIFGSEFVPGESREPYLDISRLGGRHLALEADCSAGSVLTNGCVELAFPESFVFPFDGGPRRAARVHSNGFLSFDVNALSSTSLNSSFPTPVTYEYVHLAPFWDALSWDATKYPEGNVSFLLVGDYDVGRALIIQWKDVTLSSNRAASLNFQIVLHEDGRFEYRYGDMDPGLGITAAQREAAEGKSATIGYQTPSQSSSDNRQFNTSINVWGTLDSRTFTYVPTPALEKQGSYLWYPFASGPALQAELRVARGPSTHSKSVSVAVKERPLITMTTRPSAPVTVGSPFRLGWATLRASSLVVLDEAGEAICTAADRLEVEEGFCAITEAEEGTYHYTLRAESAGGVVLDKPAEITVYEPFGIGRFEVDKELVEVGEPLTLSWETENARQISLLANGVELLQGGAPSGPGFLTVPNLAEDTTFVLRVTNSVGMVQELSRSVDVWGVRLSVTPSATKVRPGEPLTLTIAGEALDGEWPPELYGTFPLVEVEAPAPYRDISGLPGAKKLVTAGGAAGQSRYADVVLPEGFDFPYFGESFHLLRVFHVGLISFEIPTANVNNQLLPDAGSSFSRYHLAPFWDELIPNQTDSGLWTAQTDPDTFVVQWKSFSALAGAAVGADPRPYELNFQVALFRDGTFEYRYGTMTPPKNPGVGCYPSSCAREANGSSATIGYQARGGTMGLTHHFGGTSGGVDNPTYPGGLANRVLRYERLPSGGQMTFHPLRTSTYTFCATSGPDPFCKQVTVDASLGIESFASDRASVGLHEATVLRWKTGGGTGLRILDSEGRELEASTDPARIDEGTLVVQPSVNTTYTLELTAASRRLVATTTVEVVRLQLTAAGPATSHPGEPITLSWAMANADPALQPVLITPMEEITGPGRRFADLDLSANAQAKPIPFTNSTATPRIQFDPDFTFDYLGKPMSSVGISPNGALTFDAGTTGVDAFNVMIPSQGTIGQNLVHIAPFWDQLRLGNSARGFVMRSGPDTYVIQWSHLSVQTGSAADNEYDLNFMVVLHRSGDFEFRYGEMRPPTAPSSGFPTCVPSSCLQEANGSMATIGYQAVGGKVGFTLNHGDTASRMKSVAGGLSGRSWKFTKTGAATGAVQVAPWNTTVFRICALDPATGDTFCSAPVDVEVRWGIASFDATPGAALPTETVQLSWEVIGLDRLRLLADGAVLFDHSGSSIVPIGTFAHSPGRKTTYVLEGTSAGRILSMERVVEQRTFSLDFTAPAGRFFPGEEVRLSWNIVAHEAGELTIVPPPGELDPGLGPTGQVKVVVGATATDHTLCAKLGSFQECRTVTVRPVAEPGDLTFTELMIDPAGGAADQWLEIRNLSREPIDLSGFELVSSRSRHSIATSLPIAPGGLAVLAASTDHAPDYAYGAGFSLHPRVDTLELIAGGSTVASARWDSGWSIPRGGSLSLDSRHHIKGLLSHPFGSWCTDVAPSPGDLGVGCLSRFYDVDPMGEGTYYDLSSLGHPLREFEAASQVVGLQIPGFDWPFFGGRARKVWVASNGWVSFSESAPTSGSASVPGTTGIPRPGADQPPGPLLAGFWSTLRCDTSAYDCIFRYYYGELEGERTLILDWTGFRYSTMVGAISFQIQLWEDGDVKVVFGDVWSADPVGSSAYEAYRGNDSITYLEGPERSEYVVGNHRRAIDLDHRVFHFKRR